VNTQDALELKIQEGQLLAFEVDGQSHKLPVKISPAMPQGMAGLPYGLSELPFVELPAWSILKK
jgi:NADH-quinone oxidoreductase subunit G